MGAEPCRLDAIGAAGLHQRVSEYFRKSWRQVDLEPILAGIPGPGQQAVLHTGKGGPNNAAPIDPPKVGVRQGLGHSDPVAPLDGHLGPAIPLVGERRVLARVVGLEPGKVLGPVGGIHTDQVVLIPQPVDEDVVHDAPTGIQDGAVLGSTDSHLADVIAGQVVDSRLGPRALDPDLPHVRNIKKPHPSPHTPVLLLDSRVLDGHFPSTKVNQARPRQNVALEEGRSPERRCHCALHLERADSYPTQ